MEAEERPQKLRKLSHDLEDRSDMLLGGTLSTSAASAPEDDESSNISGEFTTSPLNSIDVSGVTEKVAKAVDISAQSSKTSQALSKNQLKKLKRDQKWEAGREERKARRKQKVKDKKERKRRARELENDQQDVEGGAGPTKLDVPFQTSAPLQRHVRSTFLPITILFDCQFNDLMKGDELVSLGQQLTRSYSALHHAPYRAHMVVSAWGGSLKERFDTVLSKHYQNWKGVCFTADSFLEASKKAQEQMRGPKGGKLAGAFSVHAKSSIDEQVNNPAVEQHKESQIPATREEIVYLTADSPHTITHLSPYSTYIIGALVDKNRHKGICYKIARDAGADSADEAESRSCIFRTAKLPIGDYMSMQSRAVLTTNHVSEIMTRWLECGDWGEAFSQVLPKRKGATLKMTAVESEDGDGHECQREPISDKSSDVDENVAA